MINEIVDTAMQRVALDMVKGNLNLRSIIFQAVQAGMADAAARALNNQKGK